MSKLKEIKTNELIMEVVDVLLNSRSEESEEYNIYNNIIITLYCSKDTRSVINAIFATYNESLTGFRYCIDDSHGSIFGANLQIIIDQCINNDIIYIVCNKNDSVKKVKLHYYSDRNICNLSDVFKDISCDMQLPTELTGKDIDEEFFSNEVTKFKNTKYKESLGHYINKRHKASYVVNTENSDILKSFNDNYLESFQTYSKNILLKYDILNGLSLVDVEIVYSNESTLKGSLSEIYRNIMLPKHNGYCGPVVMIINDKTRSLIEDEFDINIEFGNKVTIGDIEFLVDKNKHINDYIICLKINQSSEIYAYECKYVINKFACKIHGVDNNLIETSRLIQIK